MTLQKNNTLELLKLFASYMVVFIHVPFYGQIGVIIETIARFAVPLFFFISGYHSYQIQPKKITKRIKNILNLLIFTTICYTVFNIIVLLLNGNINGIITYFSQYLNHKTLIKLLIFNVSVSSIHSWYLLAILYVYIIFYFLTSFHFNETATFIISFLLLFLNIFLGEGLSVFGITVSPIIMRNFAIIGIPFFVAGMFTKKYNNKVYNIPNYVIIIAIIIGILESTFSRYFFGKKELYIGTLLILFGTVTIFVKYSTIKYPPFLNALSGCSTYVYIFHIIVSFVLKEIYKLFNFNFDHSVILQNSHPIIVCIVSTLLAYCVIKILNMFHSKIQPKNE